jgi:DNA-binding XRE family transcriptional regulator
LAHRVVVQTPPNILERQLAQFLKGRRQDETYAVFAKRVGLPPSTLFRLENCEQSASLKLIHQIAKRLKVSLADIFKGP